MSYSPMASNPGRRRPRRRALVGDDAEDRNPVVETGQPLNTTPKPRRYKSGNRRGELDAESVRSIVRRMVATARDYVQNDLAPTREKCWRYYNGEVDAKAKKGRSRAVDAVVRDTVDGILPQLVRVFASSQVVARYDPETPADQGMADQATRYAKYVFEKQNAGFRALHDHLKDGLVGAVGIFRAYCAHSVETTEERYEGLTQDEVTLLLSDDTEEIEILEVSQKVVGPDATPDMAPPDASMAGAPPSPDRLAGGAAPPSPMGAPPGLPPGPQPPPAQPPGAGPLGGPGGAPMPPGPPAGPAPGSPPDAGPPEAPGGMAAPNVIPFPGMLTAPQPKLSIDLTIKRTHRRKRLVIDTVDPAEFIVDPRATTEEDAYIIGMDSIRPASDVIAMGVDPEDVAAIATAQETDPTGEKAARRPTSSSLPDGPEDDSSDRSIRVVDIVVRIDQDGDGIAERRRIIALGEEFVIVRNEPTDECPYAVGSPILMPHCLIGQGIGQLMTDLQDIQTAILRQQLDSLYQAVNPRTIVVEQQVNIQDVVDNQFNGVIRARAPGMVQPYTVEFVGQQAFPMVERLDQIRENRTGLSRASQGLQADALQSSTEFGVRAVIGAALMKIELLARTYAETSIQRLFRMILALAVRYQQEPLTINLDGKDFEVDPRAWKSDMGVTVAVGLGTGNDDERKAALAFVLQKQEQILQTAGPTNPLCDMANYGEALHDFMQLTPYRASDKYFKRPTEQEMQAFAAQQAKAAQEQAGGDAQAKMAKVQADAQAKQAKAQADAQVQQGKLQLQAMQGQQQLQLEAARAQNEMELERAKAAAKLQLEQQIARTQAATNMAELQGEMQLKAYEIKEQAKVDTRLKKPEDD